jgi:anti-sigma-K factor RskA
MASTNSQSAARLPRAHRASSRHQVCAVVIGVMRSRSYPLVCNGVARIDLRIEAACTRRSRGRTREWRRVPYWRDLRGVLLAAAAFKISGKGSSCCLTIRSGVKTGPHVSLCAVDQSQEQTAVVRGGRRMSPGEVNACYRL